MSKTKMPDTSLAAHKAVHAEMKNSHYGKIIGALKVLGVANYETIAKYVGFKDRNQVSRRLKEMEGLLLVFKPMTKSSTSSGRAAYNYQLTGDSQPKTDNEAIAYRKGVPNAADYALDIAKSVDNPKVVQTTMFY
jgi:hypothetical protein